MAFEIGAIDLSMRDVETGNPLQANYYMVPGVYNDDGTPRQLSIGQLVMAICLQSATEVEATIISEMAAMSATTAKLEVLTGIQTALVNTYNAETGKMSRPSAYDVSGWPDRQLLGDTTDLLDGNLINFLMTADDKGGAGCKNLKDGASAEDIVTQLSARMDELNTVSQQQLIKLQSFTNKRDQRYDLISNVVKSLNNVLVSNANNLK